MVDQDRDRLFKEAAFKFKEAKRLEFQLHKIVQEGYVLLMRGIYPNYKSPQELKAMNAGKPGQLGEQHKNAEVLSNAKA